MTTTERDARRLGRLVEARRVALGMRTRDELADRANVSLRWLGAVERGEARRFQASKLADLDVALRWAPGSSRAVLDGGEATPTEGSRVAEFHLPGDVEIVVVGPDLPDRKRDRLERYLQLWAEEQ